MKVYHSGSKRYSNESQIIFVTPDDSKGINNMKEPYVQIIVWKQQKTIELLLDKEWLIRRHDKKE
jgi:hypothetical protein